jgi:hypothetical protein
MGEERLLSEINKRLQAKFTKFYKNKKLGDFEDNITRQRATELLAEILGKRKSQIDLHHSGSVDSEVRIYLPDNGRDQIPDK